MVNNNENTQHVNGLVLIGGRSSRMKQDKTTLVYYEKEQYMICYDLLSHYMNNVYISRREDQNIKEKYPSIVDNQDYAGIGPLAGILSAMRQFPDNTWFVLATDLPFVNTSTICHLIENRNISSDATAYISEHDNLPEPLCAIYEPRIYSKLLKSYDSNLYCPRKILINADTELLKQQNANELENVNTPSEYQEAVDKLARIKK